MRNEFQTQMVEVFSYLAEVVPTLLRPRRWKGRPTQYGPAAVPASESDKDITEVPDNNIPQKQRRKSNYQHFRDFNPSDSNCDRAAYPGEAAFTFGSQSTLP